MIVIYILAAVGAVTLLVFAATAFFRPVDPKARIREQHLERWGNKP